jgi:hypothetical protein
LKMGGFSGVSGWISQQTYYTDGVQMQVSKQVTNDLLATDFSSAAKIENVPWISPSVEVYFEDPMLPTVLVLKTSPKELTEMYPHIPLQMDLTNPEYISVLMQEGRAGDRQQLHIQLRPELYERFLAYGEAPTMIGGDVSFSLEPKDSASICYMLHLVLKVFAFASIPAYKPTPLTRKQMHYGGKPGVKNRPDRPSMRICYLPTIIRPKPPEPEPGDSKEFNGRRGHIRWYMNDRFVNRKGTWDFIRPIQDPKTGKYPQCLYKIRKP